MSTDRKTWTPYVSPEDPCPPRKEKTYETPPHLYMGIQKPGLEQFSLEEALQKGTLWPDLYSDYTSPFEKAEGKEKK